MGNQYKSEYEEDLSIDKDALDKELVTYSEVFMKWSEYLAEAMAERDDKRSEIEIKKAQLDKEIRVAPKDFGLEKVTESAISNVITENEKIQELNKEYAEFVKRVNILSAARDAMNHKRRMLEKVVELFLAGYWSDPKLRKESKNELDMKMRRRRKI